MAQMTKRERLKAVLHGNQVDRLPVAFWRHWPGDDQQADCLAQAALDYQQRYDLDFIKLPVSSTYTVNDYGVKHQYQGSLMGDRAYLERVVRKIEDWEMIQPLNVNLGTYGWHLKAIDRILKQKDKDTPLVITMFNPLSMAAYLSGDELLMTHLRTQPDKVEPALNALSETSQSFARAAIEMGADGIFLSTRLASFEILNSGEYNRFGRPGDLAVIEAARGGWLNIVHFHGQHPMLAELADYPVQVLNWHDRTTPYSLSRAAALFPGVLMGGIEQYQVLRFGRETDIVAQVRDAEQQMQGRHLIVAPGCTYPMDVPQNNLMALRRAVETGTGASG